MSSARIQVSIYLGEDPDTPHSEYITLKEEDDYEMLQKRILNAFPDLESRLTETKYKIQTSECTIKKLC